MRNLAEGQNVAAIRAAALDSSPVAGLTHCHYKYPARFSPKFVSSVIEAYSKPGDLVLDPYMGGGTTLVECMSRNRRSAGCDINSLAHFVTRAKLLSISEIERTHLRIWASEVVPQLSYFDSDPRLASVICEARTRNLNLPKVRALKKFIALALISIEELSSANERDFARCALLNSAQWALNGRRRQASLNEFRAKILETTLEMLGGATALCLSEKPHSRKFTPSLIHDSATNISEHEPFASGDLADLVITSPPYPGVHVLYHRWQVDGRKESPAPYWIAGCYDGQGESYYGFGSRKDPNHDDYFKQSLSTLQAIRRVMKEGAIMVQMLAFSDPANQLKRYQENMRISGFQELRRASGRPLRIWRDVPGRSWHANMQGKTSSAREVVLIHSAV